MLSLSLSLPDCTSNLDLNLRSRAQGQNVKIVAVDLQEMAPIPGVLTLQGDITNVSFCGPSSNDIHGCFIIVNPL